MKYKNIVKAKFISRPNRFIANVEVDGNELVVHVKNTGRCKELLLPGCTVYLEKAENPERKTPYDLVAVEKDGRIINIDSQAPNAAFKEFISRSGLFKDPIIHPEYTHGDSRFDFYIEDGNRKIFAEVKGVTLEREGYCLFPDAPTERGLKHLKGLLAAKNEGYES